MKENCVVEVVKRIVSDMKDQKIRNQEIIIDSKSELVEGSDNLMNKDKDIINIKNILLSIVIKYNNQEIRLKVDSFIAKTTFINL